MSKREENIKAILEMEISDKEKVKLISELFKPKKDYTEHFEIFWNTYKNKLSSKEMFIDRKTCLKYYTQKANIYTAEKVNIGAINYLKTVTDTTYCIKSRRFLNEELFNNFLEKEKEETKDKFYTCSYGCMHKVGTECNCF